MSSRILKYRAEVPAWSGRPRQGRGRPFISAHDDNTIIGYRMSYMIQNEGILRKCRTRTFVVSAVMASGLKVSDCRFEP